MRRLAHAVFKVIIFLFYGRYPLTSDIKPHVLYEAAQKKNTYDNKSRLIISVLLSYVKFIISNAPRQSAIPMTARKLILSLKKKCAISIALTSEPP